MMRNWLFRVSFMIIVPVAVSAVARADSWPQFRGPAAQGISHAAALPVRWSDEENVRWSREIPGLGWSSPAVEQGKVYLTSALSGSDEEEKISLRAVCLDAATGEILWDREVFAPDAENSPNIHSKNSHASPSPIVKGDRVYVHFGHHGTACLNTDGQIIWRTNEIQYRPVHGSGGSPVLVDGNLIFSTDGAKTQTVNALDAATGRILWRTERATEAVKKFSFATPLVIEVDGEKQVISQGSDAVCAIDPETGDEIWRVRYTGYSVVPRPVYGHGLLFVATGYDSPELIAIRPDGRGDVTETHVAWRIKKGAPHTPSPLLVGDELYIVSDRGVATCLDAVTGEEYWKERIGGNFSASPLYADGKIYFQSEDGEATVIGAGREYREIARNKLEGRAFASYAVSDGALFIRTEKRLFRIQPK